MTKTLKWWSEFCRIFFSFFLCETWSRISFGFCGLLWSRRQMKLNIEKEPWRVGIQCCGNFWLLKCTERWISCLVGIIRQVFWGKQAARTLHNDAFQWGWLKLLPRAWLALARVSFSFVYLFLFVVPTRLEMDIVWDWRKKSVPETVWSDSVGARRHGRDRFNVRGRHKMQMGTLSR